MISRKKKMMMKMMIMSFSINGREVSHVFNRCRIGILSSSGCCNTMMVAMACTYGLGRDGVDDVE